MLQDSRDIENVQSKEKKISKSLQERQKKISYNQQKEKKTEVQHFLILFFKTTESVPNFSF